MDKIRKSKAIVRIEFSDSTAYQKILGEYLKNSGEAKAIVYSDVSSLRMARALATDPKISLQEIECIGRKNRREMLNHVSDLDDFFMLNYQIDLRSDRPQSDPIKKSPSPSPSSSIKKTKDDQVDQVDEEDYSDLNDDEYMAIMQSRISNPAVKN